MQGPATRRSSISVSEQTAPQTPRRVRQGSFARLHSIAALAQKRPATPTPPHTSPTRPHLAGGFSALSASNARKHVHHSWAPKQIILTLTPPPASARVQQHARFACLSHPTRPRGAVGTGGKRLPSGQRRAAASDPQMGSLTSVGRGSAPRADQSDGAGGQSPPPKGRRAAALPVRTTRANLSCSAPHTPPDCPSRCRPSSLLADMARKPVSISAIVAKKRSCAAQ